MFCVFFFFIFFFVFFFFKQKTAYEIMPSLVGSEMCIRDSLLPSCFLVSFIFAASLSSLSHFFFSSSIAPYYFFFYSAQFFICSANSLFFDWVFVDFFIFHSYPFSPMYSALILSLIHI
eukprot:TRINITY_DN25710_c0_g1_i1.p1 TRINITY_DN25710_c0_g1~~TRINITY_DN25710_c0_g1_i1.p1  ORF type:complete len:119 (-),score=15.18 TRINITY_DN25710_c0_g1_i1:172-528(-)